MSATPRSRGARIAAGIAAIALAVAACGSGELAAGRSAKHDEDTPGSGGRDGIR